MPADLLTFNIRFKSAKFGLQVTQLIEHVGNHVLVGLSRLLPQFYDFMRLCLKMLWRVEGPSVQGIVKLII